MGYVKIENHQDLLRDDHTNAIINSNKNACDKYVSTYTRLKKEQEEMEKLKSDVSSLSSDLDEIKSLLKLLVKEKNNGN